MLTYLYCKGVKSEYLLRIMGAVKEQIQDPFPAYIFETVSTCTKSHKQLTMKKQQQQQK